MILSNLIEYKVVPLPEDIPAEPPKNLNAIQKQIDELAQKAEGECVVIPKNNVPVWYVFLLYTTLRQTCPEIVVQTTSDDYVVVFSLLQKKNYVRPDSVYLEKKLFKKVVKKNTLRQPEVTFDIETVTPVSGENIATVVLQVSKKIFLTDTVRFIGSADSATSLVCFVLWLTACSHAHYQSKSVIPLF